MSTRRYDLSATVRENGTNQLSLEWCPKEVYLANTESIFWVHWDDLYLLFHLAYPELRCCNDRPAKTDPSNIRLMRSAPELYRRLRCSLCSGTKTIFIWWFVSVRSLSLSARSSILLHSYYYFSFISILITVWDKWQKMHNVFSLVIFDCNLKSYIQCTM